MEANDQTVIRNALQEFLRDRISKTSKGSPATKTKLASPSPTTITTNTSNSPSSATTTSITTPSLAGVDAVEKDNAFRLYRKLCAEIAERSAYTEKTSVLHEYLEKGNTGRILFTFCFFSFSFSLFLIYTVPIAILLFIIQYAFHEFRISLFRWVSWGLKDTNPIATPRRIGSSL